MSLQLKVTAVKMVFFLICSFDGIVLVTQSHDTLPSELECLKAPLQDYSSVSVCLIKLLFYRTQKYLQSAQRSVTAEEK